MKFYGSQRTARSLSGLFIFSFSADASMGLRDIHSFINDKWPGGVLQSNDVSTPNRFFFVNQFALRGLSSFYLVGCANHTDDAVCP